MNNKGKTIIRMIWIITGLVTAILCFIAYHIGWKDGKKVVVKEWNDLYNAGFADGETYNRIFSRYEVDEDRVREIEAKILDYASNNKLEPLCRIMMARGDRKYCNSSESWTIGFGKGGWWREDEETSYYNNDELDLHFTNEREHTHTEYRLQGETVEEQAKEVAAIIARNTNGWVETEEYWACPEDVLPF